MSESTTEKAPEKEKAPNKEQKSKEAIYAAASEIAKALNEGNVWLMRRVVWTLGIEPARAFFQQAQEIEANGGMMTLDGTKRRAPGGVFFRLVKEDVAARDKKLYSRIFGTPKKKKGAASKGQPKQKKPPLDLLSWDEANKYANALLKHEKGEARTVEIKLMGRPKNVAKAKSCMVAMMEGKSAPKSLPKGVPAPPEQVQNFAVFISNKQWTKASEELKANANAELLVRGHPVFNPQKAMTMVMAQSIEVIVRKPKKPKEAKEVKEG